MAGVRLHKAAAAAAAAAVSVGMLAGPRLLRVGAPSGPLEAW